MKRSIIALICSFVSAGMFWAQTETTQTTPPALATTQKTSSTTAKTAAPATTKTAAPATATAKPATAVTAKPAATKPATPTTAKVTVTKAAPVVQWITTGSGLKYQDLVVGKGPQPKLGDDILVNYTGRFPDGKIFDSSLGPGRGPFELHLGRGDVIKGWDEGLSTMHVGGKRKLIIPPGLAYGAAGIPGVIPPNSTLTFEVELLKIK